MGDSENDYNKFKNIEKIVKRTNNSTTKLVFNAMKELYVKQKLRANQIEKSNSESKDNAIEDFKDEVIRTIKSYESGLPYSDRGSGFVDYYKLDGNSFSELINKIRDIE